MRNLGFAVWDVAFCEASMRNLGFGVWDGGSKFRV